MEASHRSTLPLLSGQAFTPRQSCADCGREKVNQNFSGIGLPAAGFFYLPSLPISIAPKPSQNCHRIRNRQLQTYSRTKGQKGQNSGVHLRYGVLSFCPAVKLSPKVEAAHIITLSGENSVYEYCFIFDPVECEIGLICDIIVAGETVLII